MALVPCKECGQKISTEAAKCPSCGFDMPKKTSTATFVIGGFFALVVGSCVLRQAGAPDAAAVAPVKSAAQIAADKASEAEFQAVVARLKALKSSSKNPASFELVDALLMPSGVLCVTYRGTNSFNAIVTENKAIRSSFEIGAWNKECAGQSGANYKYARRAL